MATQAVQVARVVEQAILAQVVQARQVKALLAALDLRTEQTFLVVAVAEQAQ
jgi:hypothetical protein